MQRAENENVWAHESIVQKMIKRPPPTDATPWEISKTYIRREREKRGNKCRINSLVKNPICRIGETPHKGLFNRRQNELWKGALKALITVLSTASKNQPTSCSSGVRDTPRFNKVNTIYGGFQQKSIQNVCNHSHRPNWLYLRNLGQKVSDFDTLLPHVHDPQPRISKKNRDSRQGSVCLFSTKKNTPNI